MDYSTFFSQGEGAHKKTGKNVFYSLGHDDAYPDVYYSDKKDLFYDIECLMFPDHCRRGVREDTNLSIEIRRKKMGDFVFVLGGDCLITDKIAELFEKEGFTGYELREVDVANKVLPFKLWQIFVVGKAKIHADCGMKEVYHCKYCDFIAHRGFSDSTGIIIDESTWNGSDFFMMEEYGYVFVTERVKKVIEDYKLTGALLVPSTELRCDETLKYDQNWTKKQWKEYFENEDKKKLDWTLRRWKKYFESP